MDKMVFVITWSGSTQAKLHYLMDNGAVVADDSKNVVGAGSISFPYDAASAPSHVLEWSLWFPGQTLQTLAAKASVNGATATNLNSTDKAVSKWASSGQT